MADKDGPVGFSPREMEVLALAWQCMETEPKINMAKLAQLTGYTHASASVTMGKIKRKLKRYAENSTPIDSPSAKKKSAPATPSTTPNPKTGTKRSAKTMSDDIGSETPSKKKGKTNTGGGGRAKAGGGAARMDNSDDEEEMKGVRIKKEEVSGLLEGVEEYYKSGEKGGRGMSAGTSGRDMSAGIPDLPEWGAYVEDENDI